MMSTDATTPLAAMGPFPVRTEPIVHWQESEAIAAEWVRAFGYPTARVTSRGADLGVDVPAPTKAIAQVKYMQAIVGRELVQLLVGARHPDCLEAMLFFSRSRFHQNALLWADIWNVALFRFDDSGNPYPENPSARKVCVDAGYLQWRSMRPPADRVVCRDDAILRREPIRTTSGTSVKTGRSALIAVRNWAKNCGFGDAIANEDDNGLVTVTAKGLVILVNFDGVSVAVHEIQRIADKPGKRIRAAVTWTKYSKNSRSLAQERSIALFRCTDEGILVSENGPAGILFNESGPRR